MINLEVKEKGLEIITEDNTIYLVKDYFTSNRVEQKQAHFEALCNIIHNILSHGNTEHVVVSGKDRYLYCQGGAGTLTLEECSGDEFILSVDIIQDDDFEKYSVSLSILEEREWAQ